MRTFLALAGFSLLAGALVAATVEEKHRPATAVVRADPRTGQLQRTVLARLEPRALQRTIEQIAGEHGVDPLLVHSMIRVESGYNPFAVSHKGAEGLMQLIPATARRFGVGNSFSITENIQGGVRYLRYLLDMFQDEELALAAYNAGEEAVRRHGGIPPYPETRNYVRLVGARYREARGPAGPEHLAEHPPIEVFTDSAGRVHIRTR